MVLTSSKAIFRFPNVFLVATHHTLFMILKIRFSTFHSKRSSKMADVFFQRQISVAQVTIVLLSKFQPYDYPYWKKLKDKDLFNIIFLLVNSFLRSAKQISNKMASRNYSLYFLYNKKNDQVAIIIVRRKHWNLFTKLMRYPPETYQLIPGSVQKLIGSVEKIQLSVLYLKND